MTIFTIDRIGVSYFYSLERCYGLPIRPVKEKKAESDTLFLKYNVLERNIAEAQQLLAIINAADYSAGSYQPLSDKYQRAVAMRAYANIFIFRIQGLLVWWTKYAVGQQT